MAAIEKIKYCGYSKQSKELMISSRLIISTSAYREGMPRVLLEAMALGKTVVASNTVGSRDLVINGETGFLFGVHNIDECAEIILEIIDNDKLLEQIGNNARKMIENKYDSQIINQTIFEVISK